MINRLIPPRSILIGLLCVAAGVACSSEAPSIAGFDGTRSGENYKATGGAEGQTEGLGGQKADGPELGACDELACSPRSSCPADGDSSACECLPGFGGPDCKDTDECAPSLHSCGSGQCTNLPGNFLCDCPSQQIEVDGECLDPKLCGEGSPCDAHALCDEDSSSLCVCSEGTVGDGSFCKQAPDCQSHSCSGSGSCVETASGYACQCETGYRGRSACEACDTLELPPALEQRIRTILGKLEGPLTPSDASHLDSLVARDLALTQLSGLECLPHLERLDLSGNRLNAEALAPLASLTRLEELRLDCNDIEDISPLSEHPALRHLSLAQKGPECGRKVKDLSALTSIKALKNLDLSAQGLESLAPLKALKMLETLTLDDNLLTSAAIESLGHRPALRALSLSGNSVDTLSFLALHPHLRELDVSRNALDEFSSLQSAFSLQVLYAADTHPSIATSLSKAHALRRLDLSGNEISDVTALLKLDHINWLNLRNNQLVTAAPFLEHGAMHSLFLDNNPLRCDPTRWQDEEEILESLNQRGTLAYATCQGSP